MDRNVTPRPIDGDHPTIDDLLSDATGLFVGLDFDGTLAPIVEDPDDPVITPANRLAIRRLRDHAHADVAVISGRALPDLETRVDVDDISYAGNHGLEFRRGGEPDVHSAAAKYRSTVRRASDRIGERLADVQGWEIEDKGATATVHVRNVTDDDVDEVRSAVSTVIAELGNELEVMQGREVFELRPPIEGDKGTAIRHLSEGIPDGWRVLYVGDDTTDEDAFRAIGPDGIGIVVGDEEESTDASYRLATQADVAPFLDWLTGEVLGGASESIRTP